MVQAPETENKWFLVLCHLTPEQPALDVRCPLSDNNVSASDHKLIIHCKSISFSHFSLRAQQVPLILRGYIFFPSWPKTLIEIHGFSFLNLPISLSLTRNFMPSHLRIFDCSLRSLVILWGSWLTGLRALVTHHLKHYLSWFFRLITAFLFLSSFGSSMNDESLSGR